MKNREKKLKIINKVDRKVVNKKSSNLLEVLKKKTNTLYIKLQLKKVDLKKLSLKFERWKF